MKCIEVHKDGERILLLRPEEIKCVCEILEGGCTIFFGDNKSLYCDDNFDDVVQKIKMLNYVECKCSHCNATIRKRVGEVDIITGGAWEGASVICPNCGIRTFIDDFDY